MTLNVEDCFDNQYYVNLRRLLTITGIWPYLVSSKRVFLTLLISVLMFVGVYTQIHVMLTSEYNLGQILELLQTLVPSTLFTLAYWNLLYYSTLVKEIIERVKIDWSEVTCEDELSILQRQAAQGKLYSQALAYSVGFYTAIALIFPSILYFFLYIFGTTQQNEFVLPINDEAIVVNTSTYFITFLLQLITIPLAYIVGITNFSLFITLLQHACALLIIVGYKIDQPFIKNEYKFCWVQTGSKQEAELEWIIAVVKNYNNAVKFIELVTSLYLRLYKIEVITSSSILIITFIYLFQLLDSTIRMGETLNIFLYSGATVLVMFLYLHLWETIIEYSTAVYTKCRLVPFYTLSNQTNKLFLLLIMRSTKQRNTINIGGTVMASHELFAKLMKVSFSFASVFYNLR